MISSGEICGSVNISPEFKTKRIFKKQKCIPMKTMTTLETMQINLFIEFKILSQVIQENTTTLS